MEAEEETLSEKQIEDLRRGLEDILTRRSAVMGKAVANCIGSFAGEMFSGGCICKDVKDDPSFDKILHEFTTYLQLNKTVKEMEDSCKVFLDALQKCGGPLQKAAQDLTERWSTYTLQSFKLYFILKPPQQDTNQSLEDQRHQRVGRLMSEGSLTIRQPLGQPMPTSSAMLGQHIRRHRSIQMEVIDNFDRHTHKPLTKTWNDHYGKMDPYTVPIAANERTQEGHWETPSSRLPRSLGTLTEDSRFSITDPSVRYSEPDFDSLHTPTNEEHNSAHAPLQDHQTSPLNASPPTNACIQNGHAVPELASEDSANAEWPHSLLYQQLSDRISRLEEERAQHTTSHHLITENNQSKAQIQGLSHQVDDLKAEIAQLGTACHKKDEIIQHLQGKSKKENEDFKHQVDDLKAEVAQLGTACHKKDETIQHLQGKSKKENENFKEALANKEQEYHKLQLEKCDVETNYKYSLEKLEKDSKLRESETRYRHNNEIAGLKQVIKEQTEAISRLHNGHKIEITAQRREISALKTSEKNIRVAEKEMNEKKQMYEERLKDKGNEISNLEQRMKEKDAEIRNVRKSLSKAQAMISNIDRLEKAYSNKDTKIDNGAKERQLIIIILNILIIVLLFIFVIIF